MASVNEVASVGDVVPTCAAGRHFVRTVGQAEVYSSTMFPVGILRTSPPPESGAGMEVPSGLGGKHIHWGLLAHLYLSVEASRPAEA